MNTNIFNNLICNIPLTHTYKLVPGKLPEKIILPENRYFIPDLKNNKDIQLYYKDNSDYISCIYDKKYNILLKISIRLHNNKIISKSIGLTTSLNLPIKNQYYIPVLIGTIGDPPLVKSTSVDHIDRMHNNDCINNLRWADPIIQNNNKSRGIHITSDDWIYIFNNVEYKNIISLYTHLKNNNLIPENVDEKIFGIKLKKQTRYGKNTYSLEIKRKLKEINTFGPEIWKELDKSLQLTQFTHISNYGRLGRIKNDIIIPRTIDNYNTTYCRLKLKKLKKEIGIHTLVYTHFIGEIQPKYIVDHIDQNKKNNHVSNLRLLTTSQNIKHSMDNCLTHNGTVGVELKNIDTGEILKFNSKTLASEYFNISFSTFNRKCISNNIIIELNDIKYELKLHKKSDSQYNNKIFGKKVQMCDKNGNIINTFLSHKDVHNYYKKNGYKFSPKNFKKIVNTNTEYNMPNIIWKSL
jgi:hypothetical protein